MIRAGIEVTSLVILWSAVIAYFIWAARKIRADVLAGDQEVFVPDQADVLADVVAVDTAMQQQAVAR